MDEGYIKFIAIQENEDFFLSDEILREINIFRNILKQHHLIGQLTDGIGFGNISVKIKNTNEFVITGSNTGYLPVLEKYHLAKINKFVIHENKVFYNGIAKPSSETMTHAAIYEINHRIQAVVHTHHHATWKKYLHQLPTTDLAYAYGTPEIAIEIRKILLQNQNAADGIIIMGGHNDGIITYGNNLEAATNLMLHYILA